MNLLFMQNGLPPYGIPNNGLIALYDPGRQILTGTTGQTLVDYTGKGNNAQLGSAVGADTNDPAWNGGVVFGTDDYCKSSSPVFDDMQAFTCITVLNIQTGATRIFDKTFNFLTLLPAASYELSFQQHFASGCYNWMGTIALTVGSNYIVSASYNRGNPTIAPAFYFNGIKDTVIAAVSTGAGNVPLDASNDLYIGNRQAADRGIVSPLYLQLWYNRVLSDAEYMQAYNGLRRLMNSRGVVI